MQHIILAFINICHNDSYGSEAMNIDIRNEEKPPLKLNIKFMREEEGISQKEIANKLGVSRSTYSLWELEIYARQIYEKTNRKFWYVLSNVMYYLLKYAMMHYKGVNGYEKE